MTDAPRILVVEDEPMVLMYVGKHFRDEGFDVVEASSGERALREIAHNDTFDAVLTDVQLGGAINGWDVAEACRDKWPGIAVLYSSADSTSFPRPVESSRYFSKPYEIEDVIEVCPLMCGADDMPFSRARATEYNRSMPG
jgi:CheY-like chemotaxis protein